MFMHFNLAAPLQSDLRKSPIAGVYTETKELMPINKNLKKKKINIHVLVKKPCLYVETLKTLDIAMILEI